MTDDCISNEANDKEWCPHSIMWAEKTDLALCDRSFRLTHCSRETHKRVFCKQCRPISDAAERGI